MEINKIRNKDMLTIMLDGKLDTSTAPDLQKEFETELKGVKELVLDFSKLAYISSAGLRTVLIAQKAMNNQGKMKVVHANDNIMEVLELTGFKDILTLE